MEPKPSGASPKPLSTLPRTSAFRVIQAFFSVNRKRDRQQRAGFLRAGVPAVPDQRKRFPSGPCDSGTCPGVETSAEMAEVNRLRRR